MASPSVSTNVKMISRIRKMRAISGANLHVIENKKILPCAYLAPGQ
jgi:hypothetical protein